MWYSTSCLFVPPRASCMYGLQSFQVTHDIEDLEPTSVVSSLPPFVLLFKRVRDAEDSGSIFHPDCLGMLMRGARYVGGDLGALPERG